MKSHNLTTKDIELAYSVFQGNFFEGSWMDNEKLEKAYIDWTKTNYPDIFEEAEGDALTIETIIKDEMEKPELLATFLNQLPDKLKKAALKELYADLDEMEDDDAEPILKKLKSIYKSL